MREVSEERDEGRMSDDADELEIAHANGFGMFLFPSFSLCLLPPRRQSIGNSLARKDEEMVA